ncbi:MAG: phosphopantetheine-binding protein [Mycoplasmataceae bacterium]|jgi:acyl carrier protein|nr:phosphopantetheine-binding protein [Mycoplasmataceae bacterium]
MKKEEIIKIIKKIIEKENISFDFNSKNLDLTLKQVGIDSLQVMSIVVAIEEELNVTIPDDQLTKIKNLNNLIDIFYLLTNK